MCLHKYAHNRQRKRAPLPQTGLVHTCFHGRLPVTALTPEGCATRSPYHRKEQFITWHIFLNKSGAGRSPSLGLQVRSVCLQPSKDGYVKETDYSFTAKKRLKEVVAGIYTSSKECRVNVKDMMEPQTKISVSGASWEIHRDSAGVECQEGSRTH